MSPALLLFDIDGTILTVRTVGRQAFNTAAARLFGEHFTFDGIDFAGHLDTLVFAEAAARHGLEDAAAGHERFREAYAAELGVRLAERPEAVDVKPGVVGLIEDLRTRDDVVLGVLTGNYGSTARLKLRAAGVDPDWFAVTAFADDAETRAGLVALAMEKHRALCGVSPERERVIVIGDTPRDVACARANGCVSFAVATGRATREELEAAGADYVVDDLSDPSPLLRLIGPLVV